MSLDPDMFGSMVVAAREKNRNKDRRIGLVCTLIYNGLKKSDLVDPVSIEDFFPWVSEKSEDLEDDDNSDEEMTRKIISIFGDPTNG